MFDPAAQRLMEQQFGGGGGGGGSGFDNSSSGPFQNNGVSVTTKRTTRSYQSTPNGGTVIRVGDDDDDVVDGGDLRQHQRRQHNKHRADLNHNVPVQQGFTSTQISSSTSSRGGDGDRNHLQAPGASRSVQVTSTKKTSRKSGASGRGVQAGKGSKTGAEMSSVQSGSPHVQGHRTTEMHQQHMHMQQQMQPQVHDQHVQMQSGSIHQQQGGTGGLSVHHQQSGSLHQQHGGTGGLPVHPPLSDTPSTSEQVNPQEGREASSQMLFSNRSMNHMLNSPGGQSDTSWASLPSAFKGPFPPGKAPIDIQVHSPTLSDDSTGTRVREVRTEIPSSQATTSGSSPKGKKFLKKVQKELEEQRGKWKDDVDKLTGGMIGLSAQPSADGAVYGTSSHVDTSSGTPIFKATVDLSGYTANEITVSVDKLVNKAVVQAVKRDHTGFPTKTFTQRIQLPRFADDPRLVTKFSKTGQLKLEVPLIYYFDEMKPEGRKAKSFVYQVNKGKDGKERLEILVNTGSGFRARDLKVQVHDDNRLVIIGEKQGEPKKLIKQYTLPAFAISDGITSRLGKDGRLQVNVPIKRSEQG